MSNIEIASYFHLTARDIDIIERAWAAQRAEQKEEQMTYIGQAQINTQAKDQPYEVGDIVVWKSADSKSARYLVEGFEGDRAVLRLLDRTTWKPVADWFVKE